MHVLITRPERDCADMKSRLEAFGCMVSLAPLLEIKLRTIPSDALAQASALIATSRNGLRALAQSPALEHARSVPLFAVGSATAALARDLGFQTIYEGGGTAAELVNGIRNAPADLRRNLVHLAGDHLAFDLAGALAAFGSALKVLPAYRSVAAETLPQPIARLLETGKLNAVVLMSPRSARVWVDVIKALPAQVEIAQLVHICLSANVRQGLKSLETLGAIRTETAVRPTTDEIVALVYRLAERAKTG